jgi:hypothetical protein
MNYIFLLLLATLVLLESNLQDQVGLSMPSFILLLTYIIYTYVLDFCLSFNMCLLVYITVQGCSLCCYHTIPKCTFIPSMLPTTHSSHPSPSSLLDQWISLCYFHGYI